MSSRIGNTENRQPCFHIHDGTSFWGGTYYICSYITRVIACVFCEQTAGKIEARTIYVAVVVGVCVLLCSILL